MAAKSRNLQVEQDSLLEVDPEASVSEFQASNKSLVARSSPVLRRAAFSLLLLGVATGSVALFYTGRPGEVRANAKATVGEQLLSTDADQACSGVEDDVVYAFAHADWLLMVESVNSPDGCCSLCLAQEKCTAWTFSANSSLSGECQLKGGKGMKKSKTAGVTSGLRSGQVAVAAKARPVEHHECIGNDVNGSCSKSKCCKDAGLQCYAKNDFWAECMLECVPGPNLLDSESSPWSCNKLGERAPGKPKTCSHHDDDCTQTQCCSGHGMQCYQKNGTFARCKPSCTAGVDMGDEDWRPWTCKPLGPRTKAPAPWVAEKCPNGNLNCAQAQCCGKTGMQCYLQNPYYGQCKPSCEKTEWNNCTTIGPRTPMLASAISNAKSTIAPWVLTRCSDKWMNCMSSQCCHQVDSQCYAKNSTFATCKQACNSTELDPDDNSTWTCDELGPRSWGLALKGYPSLFCFSLYMPSRYEGPLMKSQLKRGAGIFACDGFDVFAAENDTLGMTKDGIEVKSVLIPKITVGVSQDNTAGNAKLFMAVWDKVIAGGRFLYYDWTIKVDPDAVLLPWRLRTHMEPHTGENVFVVNCNKFPNSPNFPMMYGALEVFSRLAMMAYAQGSWKCGTQLPWKSWGEDYYMTHCMDYLMVQRISDFSVIGDNMCVGANCADGYTASFHPFKTRESWHKCWDIANGIPLPKPKNKTKPVA